MGASQRRKGHDWERAVAQRFRETMPGAHVKRGLQSRAGNDAPDVVVPFFHVECKVGSSFAPEAALAQAEQACADPTLWPIAVVKRDFKDPFVCMRLDDFLELVAAWYREVKS